VTELDGDSTRYIEVDCSTNLVLGEGFSTVVENSFGLPNPEEMARISVAERRKLLEEAQNIKEPEVFSSLF
jgi:hypothetical protein